MGGAQFANASHAVDIEECTVVDTDLYAKAIEYEKLTQAIYQSILNKEGVKNVQVQHNEIVKGKSRVGHQIDVLWRFKQAGVKHSVLVECKNYSSAITLEKVRNFFAVLHDIGNVRGIMVTRIGYQEGVKHFASFYGIDLKLLREPTEDDWKGKIKDVKINLIIKSAVSTETKPITVEMVIRPSSKEQEARLKQAQNVGGLKIAAGPELQFLDKAGVPTTEEMCWWLPKQLKVLEKSPGGPYEQVIELQGKYANLPVNGKNELIEVIRLKVKYYVEEMRSEIAIHGNDIVQAILKDLSSGKIEHVQRK